MGICFNCIYKGEKINDTRKNPHLRKEDYTCENKNNSQVDFVTGELELSTCRACNGIGECLYFDDGSVPLYAWQNDGVIVYTLSEEPQIDNSVRGITLEILGQITSVNTLYAIKSDENVFYVLSDTVAADYDVYNKNGKIIGKVISVNEDETITIEVDETSYICSLSTENNIENASITYNDVSYYRDENDDTEAILPE